MPCGRTWRPRASLPSGWSARGMVHRSRSPRAGRQPVARRTGAASCASPTGGGAKREAHRPDPGRAGAAGTGAGGAVGPPRCRQRQHDEYRGDALHVWPPPQLVCRSSTRRFCARPVAVVFGATGCDAPYPLLTIRSGVTPLLARYARTASARACDRRRFVAEAPVLSVWPPISILIAALATSDAATMSRIVYESGFNAER